MNTLIISLKNMEIAGGIENAIYYLVKQFIQAGDKVICLKNTKGIIDDSFKLLLENKQIDIVEINPIKLFWYKNVYLNIPKDGKIVAFVSNMREYSYIETIKHNLRIENINIFYWIPHYLGAGVFTEEYWPKIIQIFLKKWLSNMYKKMDDNNNIYYGNKRHLASFTNHYHYIPNCCVEKILNTPYYLIPRKEFDMNDCILRSKREVINIVAIARIVFPHKGFILGLVRVIDNLIVKYPHIRLRIVGDGDDMSVLKAEVDKVNKKVTGCITLVGIVPPEKLNEYCKGAHLNIGVASTVSIGASNGVISIPARSYSCSCEVYGYLPEAKENTLSTKPGEPVNKYIEDIILMPSDRFIDLSYKSYCTYNNTSIIQFRKLLLSMSNLDTKISISWIYRQYFIWGYRFANIFTFMKKRRTN